MEKKDFLKLKKLIIFIIYGLTWITFVINCCDFNMGMWLILKWATKFPFENEQKWKKFKLDLIKERDWDMKWMQVSSNTFSRGM
jgi:hypothetical protein